MDFEQVCRIFIFCKEADKALDRLDKPRIVEPQGEFKPNCKADLAARLPAAPSPVRLLVLLLLLTFALSLIQPLIQLKSS